jgi:hypothetical protein
MKMQILKQKTTFNCVVSCMHVPESIAATVAVTDETIAAIPIQFSLFKCYVYNAGYEMPCATQKIFSKENARALS